jgi:hypothetical protein
MRGSRDRSTAPAAFANRSVRRRACPSGSVRPFPPDSDLEPMKTVIFFTWSVLLLLGLTACSDDDAGSRDATPDISGDAGDASGAPDAQPGDADAGDPDAPPDTTPDQSGVGDASPDAVPDLVEDTPALCEYLDLEIYLVHCGDEREELSLWTDLGGNTEECPDFWSFGGLARYDSMEEAAAARGCDLACVYRPASAVMFLHCGHRDEYFSWEAEDESCPRLLQFQTGFYDDMAAYREDNPCECGANQFLLEWPTSGYVIDFEVTGQNGYVWVTSEAGVAHLASFIAGTTEALGNPSGPTEANGQFNPGYTYRLAPGSVTFAGESTEVCDVTPCHIEENWTEWAESPNSWCPSQLEAQGIYDCTGGDGEFCEQVWP